MVHPLENRALTSSFHEHQHQRLIKKWSLYDCSLKTPGSGFCYSVLKSAKISRAAEPNITQVIGQSVRMISVRKILPRNVRLFIGLPDREDRVVRRVFRLSRTNGQSLTSIAAQLFTTFAVQWIMGEKIPRLATTSLPERKNAKNATYLSLSRLISKLCEHLFLLKIKCPF